MVAAQSANEFRTLGADYDDDSYYDDRYYESTMMATTMMRPRTEQAQTATHENVQSALRNLRALRHLR